MKFSKENRGYTLGDTILTGLLLTLKDGSYQHINLKEPIIIKTEEENNGK